MFNAIRRTVCNKHSTKWIQTQIFSASCNQRSSMSTSQGDEEDPTTTSKSLVVEDSKAKLVESFPNYFKDGTIHNRAKYTDFIYDALNKLEELGLHKDLETYKELIKVFPTDQYHPLNAFSRITMFSPKQQVCALHILFEMERHQVWPDKEVEKLIVERFSTYSEVWLKCARMNFWSMKFRNRNPWPLPEVAPDDPVELTKLALARMCVDKKTILSVWNASRVPTSIDKTWIVSAQSDIQQDMINRLNSKDLLYIEEGGRVYIREKSIIYYVLKQYYDTPKVKPRYEEPEQDYESMPIQFYGKPIKERQEDLYDIHNVEDGNILAIAVTGTSSHDSLLSWLRLMQERNAKLKEISVVFRINRPSKELVDLSKENHDTEPSARIKNNS